MIRSDDGTIQGYICLREIDIGYSLQPFYANTQQQADRLLRAVLWELNPGSLVQWSTPLLNQNAFKLLQKYFEA